MAAASDMDSTLHQAHPVNDLISSVRHISLDSPVAASPSSAAASSAAVEISDRDSANHSPSDFLSGINHSDTHSESSNDSGKGGSDCAVAHLDAENGSRFAEVMTPPLSPAHAAHLAPLPERLFVYEFEIPQTLCGLLIGRFGAYVHHIKAKTGASLLIKRHMTNKRLKVCAIEGTKNEIDATLVLLRAKFPLKRYPLVTFEQINVSAPTAIPVLPDSIQLHLPAEVSCDVVVSAVVAPNHVFVQQVTHPTYPSLARLDVCMTMCYNEFETPPLPRPIQPSMVCAAPSLGGWYRAKVIAVHPSPMASVYADGESKCGEVRSGDDRRNVADEPIDQQVVVSDTPADHEADDEQEEVDICFVDYGGYARVPASSLRQIRADFMSLPFQAVECLLANVAPLNEEEGWSAEAFAELENETSDRLLSAQVVAYSLEGPPLIYMYQMTTNEEAVLVNRQLVTRGVAQWVEPQLIVN